MTSYSSFSFFQKVKNDLEVKTLIEQADQFLKTIGYTDHGFRHAEIVAERAAEILAQLDYQLKFQELALIAAYLHDLGNVVGRSAHAPSGAILAYQILRRLGMKVEDASLVMQAIANHDDDNGDISHFLTAALTLADKSHVHRNRVRNPDNLAFDIHDRVNFAACSSSLDVDKEGKKITLKIEIDTRISSVMEYFEIFLSRMTLCREAAEVLGCKFSLVINDTELL